jgi:DNA-binding NarL/FixJ family response regulator
MHEFLVQLRAAGTTVVHVDDPGDLDPATTIVLAPVLLSTPRRVAALAARGFQVIVLLADDSPLSPALCVGAGASAVVQPDTTPADLAVIVDVTRRGLIVVPNTMKPAMVEQARAVADLSSQEREWLRDAAAGRTLAEIAARHGCSVRTLHRRMQRIYEHLAVVGLSQALAVVAAWDTSGT